MIRSLVLLVILLAAAGAPAQVDIPLDKQKGVRGRVIIAPEVLSTPVPLAGEREKLMKSPAVVRRPLGRPIATIEEPAPAITVMLEGEGIRAEHAPQKLVVAGMRFVPGGVVVPRPMAVTLENKQAQPITIYLDKVGTVLASLKPGEAKDVTMEPGEHLLRIKEIGSASAAVRVLERGRALPLNGEDIPLVDIPGGTYELTFFFGAEPLRIQPLTVPDFGLVFIDATVSANKVVEVAVKDASMRVAVPPSLRTPPPDAPDDGVP